MGLRTNHRADAVPRWNQHSLLWVLCIFSAMPAVAQQAGQVGVDVRQLERRFEQQELGQSADGGRGVAIPRVVRSESSVDATPLFVLRKVSIAGASAIPLEELAAASQPYIGRKVSQADLAAISVKVGDVYRAAGFHLSRASVPPQDIAGGTVRIEVIEGSITDIRMNGEGVERFGIRSLLSPLLAEKPSRLASLERQLMLVNTRPGVRIVDTQLEEIGKTSGQFRLVVSVQTWSAYAFAGIDNLGSSAVGPWQSYATAAYNSMVAPGDTLALNLATTPGDPRQLRFARLSYDIPLGDEGLRVGASGLHSEVWPGDWRRLFSDNTKTDTFELRASISPLMSQKQALTLTIAAGFSNVSEHDVLGPLYSDAIRTISLNAEYRLQDNFGGTNLLTVNWRQGLDVLGASDKSDPWVSVSGASPKFSALNFWFTRYQTLNDAWSLKLTSAGQTASGPMYLSQQFHLGGLAFGRGYGAALVSGDNGVAGSLELRFDQKLNYKYWTGFQIYSFVDSGLAWWSGFRTSDGTSLTSAGGGVRLFLGGDLQADLGVAVPLGYREPDNWARHPRFLFTLSNALKFCPERAATRCS
jgi:hemolysin activation/secretion protein